MNSALEESLKENKSVGNYIFHLNDWVTIHTPSRLIIGKMIFTDYDKTLLYPSLVDESLSRSDVKYRIDNEKPTTINTQLIQDVSPSSENYAKEIVEYYQKKQEIKEIKKDLSE